MGGRTSHVRAGGVAGLLFIVLLLVGLFLPGAPPHASDSIASLTRLTRDVREQLLVGQFVLGLAVPAGLVFLAALRQYLGDPAHERDVLAVTAAAGGLFALVFTLLGALCFTALSFKAVKLGDGALVRFVADLGNDSVQVAKFGFATVLAAGSAALAGRPAAPRWLIALGYLGAAFATFTAVALFSESSAFEAGGPVDLAGAVPVVAWLVVTAIAMTRSDRAGELAAA